MKFITSQQFFGLQIWMSQFSSNLLIQATLEGYKVDSELIEKQLIKKCSAIKFADNLGTCTHPQLNLNLFDLLEELSKLITDASSRADHSQK